MHNKTFSSVVTRPYVLSLSNLIVIGGVSSNQEEHASSLLSSVYQSCIIRLGGLSSIGVFENKTGLFKSLRRRMSCSSTMARNRRSTTSPILDFLKGPDSIFALTFAQWSAEKRRKGCLMARFVFPISLLKFSWLMSCKPISSPTATSNELETPAFPIVLFSLHFGSRPATKNQKALRH